MEIIKFIIVLIPMFILTQLIITPLPAVYGFMAIPLSCFVGGCLGYITACIANKWIN